MHNTLIAAGPDFHQGEADELPSGNVDLAPTIFAILGIKSPAAMDGRFLAEAMASAEPLRSKTETLEAKRKFPGGTWQQNLTISHVGSTVYFDGGNGGFIR
jgi:arylsulfatase A-like enzyme